MPSYSTPSPPLSSFSKTNPRFSRPAPSACSTKSIPSQRPENMIPPQYATNFNPSPQFSNFNTTFQPQMTNPSTPTPAEQNFTLCQQWRWVPQTECSLLNDSNPNAVYLITLVTWDGYDKSFDLQLLTPSTSTSSPTRSSRPKILQNIAEHELLPPREAIFYPTTLPLPPRETLRKMSTGPSVGMHGQAMGIGVSNVQASLQHHVTGGGASSGRDFLYTQYSGAVNSPTQYFESDQRRRYGGGSESDYGSSHSASFSDREQFGARSRNSYGNGGRDRRKDDRKGSWSGSGSGSRDSSSDRERGRGSFGQSRRSNGRKEGGSGKKDKSRNESSKNAKREPSQDKKKSDVSKGKKAPPRSSSLSPTRSDRSSSKKK